MKTWKWVIGISLVLGYTQAALAAEWFVATNGSDSADGTSWATAKLTIQAGVDAAASNDTVWVSNGVYDTGVRLDYGAISNRVVIDKPVMVRSVNGPDVTVIDGSSQVRGVCLTTNAVLDGFTVTRGWSLTGGGINCDGYALITNCFLVRNAAVNYGGGVAYGDIWNCMIAENTLNNTSSNFGGGTYCSNVRNSLISSNSVQHWCGSGGGTFGGNISNCQITANFGWYGGGTARGFVENCVIESNAALQGGGSFLGTNRNCLILYNRVAINDMASQGGGANGSLLENCTVCANSAHGGTEARGAGAYNCKVLNSILYLNRGDYSWDNCIGGTADFSCVEFVLPSGNGNMTNDPCFVDGFHLPDTSTCIDAGTNLAWAVNATDIDGGPRIRNGRVDIGCYEQSRSSSIEGSSITSPIAVPAGGTGYFRTTNSTIPIEGLKIAGSLTVWTIGQGACITDGVQQVVDGTTWSNSLSFTNFQSILTYRSITNIEANPVSLTSTVFIVTRAGTDAPGISITSAPPVFYYSETNVILGGTNNPHIVGTMWITNAATGESLSFPAPVYPAREWTAPAIVLSPGDNPVTVCGSNAVGTTSSCMLTVVRGGQGLPALGISTATPALASYITTNCILAGTNNEHVAEVWVSNALNGATLFCGTSTGSTWTSPAIPLEVGTNRLNALGYNLLGQAATATITVVRYLPRTFYVDAATTNPVAPYQSGDTAASLITTVLPLALDTDTIMVGPGKYTNSLVISNQIHLVSSDGPRATIIQASGGRCITITHSNAVVSGFTITGGFSANGAGVAIDTSPALVENCIISNNTYSVHQSSSSSSYGGGICGGRARNCLIVSNSIEIVTYDKGSAAAAYGAGAANCTLENCTMAGNHALAEGYYSYGGGGGYQSTFINSIEWSNSYTSWGGEQAGYGGNTYDHSCTNDPGFVNTTSRLNAGSPCVNAGTNQEWMADATDLDGYARIYGSAVDMGCYEYGSTAPHLTAPTLEAPVEVASGGIGLWRSTNDSVWVVGTKSTNTLVAVSSTLPDSYSTNGVFQEGAGTVWSNLLARNWEPPAEIKTWHFRCNPLAPNAIESSATTLRGTAAGLCGSPAIQIVGAPASTTHASYGLTGNRNLQTLENMWVSNQANGATAFYAASLLPTTNWAAPSLPLQVGTNVLYAFGTNLLGETAFAQHEIVLLCYMGSISAASNGAVNVEWTMRPDPGITYQWQRTTNLANGNWTNFGGPFVSTQEIETLIESNLNAVPVFFRMIHSSE